MFRTNGTKLGGLGEPSYSLSSNLKGYSTSENLASKDRQTSSNASKFDSNDYVPKRFALKFDAPTIIIEYLVPSSGKLYHHKMKLTNLHADSDTSDALESLKKKNYSYFEGNKISDEQMKNFIEKIKRKLQGTSRPLATGANYGENKNQSGVKSGTHNAKEINKVDSLANSDLNRDKGSVGVPSAKTPSKAGAGNNFWAFDDLEDYNETEGEQIDYATENLNKLTKEELQKHKDKMDVLFNKNQKKPGDEGFVYDKQEEFVPQGDNEWDDEF